MNTRKWIIYFTFGKKEYNNHAYYFNFFTMASYFIGWFILVFAWVLGLAYSLNKKYEEVRYVDKRTWKIVSRIRDRKTKKFV